MTVRLSWLDFRFPVSSIGLAAAADDLGYHRYWLGEHHGPQQSPNPLLLGALLAGTTRGLRLGSGGVCLDYQSPYRIAEDAHLIELLLPGRFDLGVTRGLWLSDALRSALLDGREPVAAESHLARLGELHGFLTGRLPGEHPLRGHLPFAAAGPPMWILGLGAGSARAAGRLGTGFCFSLHHAPEGLDGPAVVEEYRRAFLPSPEFPEPEAILVAGLTCASTGAEARRLTDAYLEESGARIGRRPALVGDAAHCAGRLLELADRFGAGEVMVVDLLPEAVEPRLHMQALLAEELRLEPR